MHTYCHQATNRHVQNPIALCTPIVAEEQVWGSGEVPVEAPLHAALEAQVARAVAAPPLHAWLLQLQPHTSPAPQVAC